MSFGNLFGTDNCNTGSGSSNTWWIIIIAIIVIYFLFSDKDKDNCYNPCPPPNCGC